VGGAARRVGSAKSGDASRPLVSVILPTCDRPTRLLGALESVLTQDYGHLEAVVVDDASTVPAETAVASAAEDPRVRIIRLPRRTGAAGARNAGLAMASADLVAFIDDDDRWHPHKVRRQVEAFESRPELGLVTCDYFVVDEHARESTVVYRGPPAFTAAQVQWMNLPGGFSFVMARRSALGDELRLDETFPSVEDWDLWLRCARMAPVEVLREPLCHHVVHGGLSRPSSERVGMELFLRKHADTMSPVCRAYVAGHLRMYKGTGWRKKVAVVQAMATPSARASAMLVMEQGLRVAARRRRDPGLVARTIATVIGSDGRAAMSRRRRTEPEVR
jgi:glycosyltransferase involved in cell wall biosynthesis